MDPAQLFHILNAKEFKMFKNQLSWEKVSLLTGGMVEAFQTAMPREPRQRVYGIPRGGVYVAQAVVAAAVRRRLPWTQVTDPSEATLFVDDIIDSGATMKRYRDKFPNVPFLGMVKADGTWVVFPWEVDGEEDEGIENNILRILQYIGEDPKREGLVDTPKRVAKAYLEMFNGYKLDPSSVMTSFEDGTCDEMVLLKNIEFSSFCEHHMLPFRGQAHVGYIPDGRVIGVSKLARILDIYAARLQIQERIGMQVTTALDLGLKPKGSACIIEAQHQCMSCRGVRKQNSVMVTSSLTGVFLSNSAARAELFSLMK